jgi:hypothetical protein
MHLRIRRSGRWSSHSQRSSRSDDGGSLAASAARLPPVEVDDAPPFRPPAQGRSRDRLAMPERLVPRANVLDVSRVIVASVASCRS